MKTHIKRTKDGAFDWGYCASEKDMCGRIEPKFRPYWWAQYRGDGTQEMFDTKKECLRWIAGWYKP